MYINRRPEPEQCVLFAHQPPSPPRSRTCSPRGQSHCQCTYPHPLPNPLPKFSNPSISFETNLPRVTSKPIPYLSICLLALSRTPPVSPALGECLDCGLPWKANLRAGGSWRELAVLGCSKHPARREGNGPGFHLLLFLIWNRGCFKLCFGSALPM